MSEHLQLLAQARSFSDAVGAGREAGNEIGKTIESIQKDGVDLANARARERLRQQREAELKANLIVIKAINEYQRLRYISDAEANAQKEFIKKYGSKEWAKVMDLKRKIEEQEKRVQKEYDEDLSKIRTVQIICFVVAGWIAYYIVWGSK